MMIPDSNKLRFYDDKKKEYSIADLTEATGLKPRTIYFYVQEKIIPRPSGAGSSARYGEEHRIKLLLIKKLKDEQRMNLRVIRNILEDIEFVHAPMPGVPAIPAGEDELDIILDHFLAASARHESSGELQMFSEDASDMDRLAVSMPRRMPKLSKGKAHPAESRINLNLWRSAQMPLSSRYESEEDEKTWRKEMIVDGMDLYVRRDIERKYGNEIRDQILELKKKIKESKKD